MNIDIRTISVKGQLGDPGVNPHAMIKRNLGANHAGSSMRHAVDITDWVILHDTLPKEPDQLRWGKDSGGTHVAVPLYPYQLEDVALSELLRFGGQFATMGEKLIASHVAAGGKEITRLVIFYSEAFARPDGHPGYCVYAGMAARITK